jgi:predicted transcriptional regulator of viral defense system
MARSDLLQIAAAQQGYFRTRQALEAGWTRRALNWAAHNGEIEPMRYGLYRFAHYPATPRDELHELQTIAPEGTFSHETALMLWGLSDLLPRTTHFTVPLGSGFKPRLGITVHHRALAAGERTLRDGLWITSLPRTLFDSARAGADPEQMLAAAREARERALLGPDALAAIAGQYPFTMLES